MDDVKLIEDDVKLIEDDVEFVKYVLSLGEKSYLFVHISDAEKISNLLNDLLKDYLCNVRMQLNSFDSDKKLQIRIFFWGSGNSVAECIILFKICKFLRSHYRHRIIPYFIDPAYYNENEECTKMWHTANKIYSLVLKHIPELDAKFNGITYNLFFQLSITKQTNIVCSIGCNVNFTYFGSVEEIRKERKKIKAEIEQWIAKFNKVQDKFDIKLPAIFHLKSDRENLIKIEPVKSLFNGGRSKSKVRSEVRSKSKSKSKVRSKVRSKSKSKVRSKSKSKTR